MEKARNFESFLDFDIIIFINLGWKIKLKLIDNIPKEYWVFGMDENCRNWKTFSLHNL
jgi:hypothetical protein